MKYVRTEDDHVADFMLLTNPDCPMRTGNVLVVEDDDAARRLRIEYMTSHEFVYVDGSRGGVEALTLLARNHYAD